MAAAILDAARLRELIHYDSETGVFLRRVRTAQCHQVGDRADLPAYGSLLGYRTVGLGGRKHLAHRMAWLYVFGTLPEMQIDHKNGDKSDNRIENLRLATPRLNSENRRTAYANSSSGLLGVYLHKQSGRWRARLNVKGVSKHIGMYDTPELAHAAYLDAKRKLHDGCTI